jgi:Acetyltransferase (GNAT) domain
MVHHLGAWAAILASCYRYRPRYIALEVDGGLVGVLPLVSSGLRLSGSRLSSLPTSKAAGPLALSAEHERALLTAALEIKRQEGLSSMTVRSQSAGLESGGGVQIDDVSSTQVLELDCSPEALLDGYKQTSVNVYRNIRKAKKSGLVVGETESDRELREWYRLYLLTIRRHRTLPRRLRQLREARVRLGDHWRLVTVKRDGAVIAGGVFHDIAGTVELMYNASDPGTLSLRPNHALYWHVITDSIARGRVGLDFGVSNHDTLVQFKQQWGTTPHGVYVYGDPGTSEEGQSDSVSTPSAGTPSGKTRLAARMKSLAGDAIAVSPLTINRAIGSVAYRIV